MSHLQGEFAAFMKVMNHAQSRAPFGYGNMNYRQNAVLMSVDSTVAMVRFFPL